MVLADSLESNLKFEVSLLNESRRFLPLLERPGYLAIALERNDMSPSVSGKLNVRDSGRTVELRNIVLKFRDHKDSVYYYDAEVLMPSLGKTLVSIPVQIDLSLIKAGKATITIGEGLAKLVPEDLKDRIYFKMHTLASANSQKIIVDYLSKIEQESAGDSNSAIYELILQDAYNNSSSMRSSGRDVGDALPISDQFLFLLSVGIWLVGLPIAYSLSRKKYKSIRKI